MGSNIQQQLGIGKHHVQALQPMLIREFDNKNVTLIEAGQYHNAVYADGELYTFGWGIYGQLGHGDIFALDRPKKVRFFSGKCVKQIALGHAHTLVLCSNKQNANQTDLYIFGCNLFGQLGTGQYQGENPSQKYLKSSTPVRLSIRNETITQIHTKFFTNVSVQRSRHQNRHFHRSHRRFINYFLNLHFQFVITQSNKLYTWGASPQLIRLLNQSRKRARKCEDNKTTVTNENGDKSSTSSSSNDAQESSAANVHSDEPVNQEVVTESDANSSSLTKNIAAFEQSEQLQEVTKTIKLTANNLQDRIKNFLRTEIKQPTDKNQEVDVSAKINSEYYLDDEYTDHFLPQQVDTSEVAGQLIQVRFVFKSCVFLNTILLLFSNV